MEEKIIDTEIAKMVFGDNEDMYKKYLFQLVDRDLYGEMEGYIKEGNIEKAFETAHTMKGLVQNLALTKFAEVLEKMVEVMRNGTAPSDEQRSATEGEYNKILQYLDYIRDNDIKILQ